VRSECPGHHPREARHALAPVDRPARRGCLAVAVTVGDHVGREQLDELHEVIDPAVAGDGVQESAGELIALGALGLELRPSLLDVAASPDGELAAVVLALTDDLGDLAIAVVEHLAQQEHGPLDRGEPLEQQQEGHR